MGIKILTAKFSKCIITGQLCADWNLDSANISLPVFVNQIEGELIATESRIVLRISTAKITRGGEK